MQEPVEDSVNDRDVGGNCEEQSSSEEEDEEVIMPGVWPVTAIDETANVETTNGEELVGAMEKLGLEISTSQTS